MTRLLLIRHGMTDLIAQGVLVGWTPDVHLNQQGREQVELLARRLAPVEIEAVYTSPLERAVETAEMIAAPHGLPVVVRERLGEMIFGDWTGKTVKQLAKRQLWRAVRSAPSTVRIPGGEGFRQMQARAVAELDDLGAQHPQQTIAVVSHADVIKAAVACYIGIHLDLFQRLVISPASLTMLELGSSTPLLLCLNDTGHLPPDVEEGE